MLKTPLYIVEYINQVYERFSLLNLLMMLDTTNNNYIMVLPWQKLRRYSSGHYWCFVSSGFCPRLIILDNTSTRVVQTVFVFSQWVCRVAVAADKCPSAKRLQRLCGTQTLQLPPSITPTAAVCHSRPFPSTPTFHRCMPPPPILRQTWQVKHCTICHTTLLYLHIPTIPAAKVTYIIIYLPAITVTYIVYLLTGYHSSIYHSVKYCYHTV